MANSTPDFKRDGPLRGARQRHSNCSGLDDLNVRRLQALLALNDLELDALAFLEGLVALLSDGREVDEDVLSLSALDEAVALLVREPLDGAFSQLTASFNKQTTARRGRRPGIRRIRARRLQSSVSPGGRQARRTGTARPSRCCAKARRSSAVRRPQAPASGALLSCAHPALRPPRGRRRCG